MTLISSRRARFLKRVFPVFWFGTIAAVLVAVIASRAYERAPVSVFVPLVLAGVGFLVIRKTLWDLADEVFDCGDHLLVRKGDEEVVVPLSGVIGVASVPFMNPPRITLRLATPGPFGDEISFSPVRPFTLNPFARIPVADDLMWRVDRARRSAGGRA